MGYGHTVNGSGGTGEGLAWFAELGTGEPPLGKDRGCDRPAGAGDEEISALAAFEMEIVHSGNPQAEAGGSVIEKRFPPLAE
jgi:hypothetical protein